MHKSMQNQRTEEACIISLITIYNGQKYAY